MMGKNVKRTVLNAIIAGVAVLLAIGFYGMAIALQHNTFVNGWIPFSIAAVVGTTTGIWGWKMWRRLTGSESVWINFPAHAVFFTGMVLFAIYALNYYCADPATAHEEQAVVARRYTKTRHRTERVGRRGYRQGAPYKVYFIELDFPGGRSKDMELSRSQYVSRHKGDTVTLSLREGLLGLTVIRD